jgi:large subunit ribosomal protein L21
VDLIIKQQKRIEKKEFIIIFATPKKIEIMYAIVEIGGHQFKVVQDQEIFVLKLDGNAGDKVNFDKVLMLSGDAGTTIGAPTISGSSVAATIVGHQKGDKVIVFKKKRRKGYKVKNGFRASYTKVKIDAIA